MVSVAQLVEHRIVAPGVEGSKPFRHPYDRAVGSHEPAARRISRRDDSAREIV